MLIPVSELEFREGKKINSNGLFIKAGIKQLIKKDLVKDEGNERVIELPELILEMYGLICLHYKTRGNNNNPTGKIK
jgi:hypothetical protein